MVELYGKIKGIDKKVSRLIFGTAIGPMLAGENADELLDGVATLGINTFDLARAYGGAEKSFGHWLKNQNRDELVLISKCAHPSLLNSHRLNEKEIRKDFEKSTKELGTDYIDIYLLHRDDPDVPVGTIVEIMNGLHAEGKIGIFGGSNWEVNRVAEANEYAYQHNLQPFMVSSPNFGVAEQVKDPWGGGCVSIAGPSHAEERKWYAKKDIPIIAYSSLARGMFSGKAKSSDPKGVKAILDAPGVKGYYSEGNLERLRRCEVLAEKYGCSVSQVALAYVIHADLNAFAVVSSTKVERMKSNIGAIDVPLTQEDVVWLEA